MTIKPFITTVGLAMTVALLTGCLQTHNQEPPIHERCDYQHYTRSPFYTEDMTFNTIPPDFKYINSLTNNYNHYVNNAEIVLEYESKTSGLSQTREAVILIHGTSSTPDQFFNNPIDPNGIPTYLNNAGDKLFEEGFDVYAPYVTHASQFQKATRRLASLKNERFQDLDAKRIVKMYNKIKDKYDRIHIFGTSYGGLLAVYSFEQINKQQPNNNVGEVLSIEGWVYSKNALNDQWNNALFHPNYQMVFTMVTQDEFWTMLNHPKVHIAYSSCFENNWSNVVTEASNKNLSNKIIRFEGTHEFRPELLLELIEGK